MELSDLKPGIDYKERITRHIKTIGECWIWQGKKDHYGYGWVKIGGKIYLAHRLAYLLWCGSYDNKLNVCHTCDNPSCVSPVHLFTGTLIENIQDCIKKGRRAKTSTSHRITMNIAIEIRDLFNNKNIYNKRELARIFNVSPRTIRSVLNYESWK